MVIINNETILVVDDEREIADLFADFYDADAFIPWKPLLRAIMFAAFFILFIAGGYYVAYRFLLKPLEYLDDVTEAARLLAAPTEAPVSLPADLKSIEDDLNAVRIQALEGQKAVQEAERRKDDLLVYLAHDLKTPLTSVLGYLKLLEDEPDISPELISKYTGIARRKAERLEELINEFFEIARFSTNKLVLEPKATNISRMLMQIAYEFPSDRMPLPFQEALKIWTRIYITGIPQSLTGNACI